MKEEPNQQRIEPGSFWFNNIKVIHGNLVRYASKEGEVKSDCCGLRNVSMVRKEYKSCGYEIFL